MKFLSNKNIKQNIIIGTAQLGENYGISNKNINYEIKSRIEFLDFCYQNGFHSFDTAYTYKNSHKIIGDWLYKKDYYPKIKLTGKFQGLMTPTVPNGWYLI